MILVGGQSVSARPVRSGRLPCPRQGFSPGIATHCPRPWGRGEEAGGRAGWGLRGRIYGFRRLVRGGARAPSPVPTPRGDSHHGPLPG
ncbi:conserved protein of unknown function [Methanoculleus bourgensis]|uniref:Uncharacterized protein n=1 Tax=Methanoculleus bourgensis TaxID=83986 RepID=A0A0X3BJR3_9EURY|nr:conserved protein of unknown function [Methanoculleus bourgensis]